MSGPIAYDVRVFCNECDEPHRAGVRINLDERIDATQNVADIYDGRELPRQLANLSDNVFTCPSTGRKFRQANNAQVFLEMVERRNTDRRSGNDRRAV